MDELKNITCSNDSVAKKLRAVTLLLSGHRVEHAIEASGLSRSTVYRALRSYKRHGIGGLEIRPRTIALSNTFPQDTVDCVLSLTRKFPTYSYPRVAQKARDLGCKISNSGVQKIWRRNGLTNRSSRLQWVGRLGH